MGPGAVNPSLSLEPSTLQISPNDSKVQQHMRRNLTGRVVLHFIVPKNSRHVPSQGSNTGTLPREWMSLPGREVGRVAVDWLQSFSVDLFLVVSSVFFGQLSVAAWSCRFGRGWR